ncbi:HmuY family protein [Pedobacter sp. MC2016-24]|uniref:HmuY family protein n=1 Tax=Pedobacter sp. MC2016-24 TaxID=2780090 RepID=UPI0018827877|nr:HmuY family protein [Pedobacter sp. MC2016-24]MBE9598161.1 HmuY family protein [Pedobacter sp. MC2016-24]
MKKNKLIHGMFMLAVFISFVACTKDEIKPDLEDGKSTIVKDLPGDVGNTVGSAKPFEIFYFSFNTNTKVDKSKLLSSDWDIAFAKEYNSYVSVNNGNSDQSYGFGGSGKAAMVVVNQAYDAIKTAPLDDEFVKNGVTAVGWDPGNGVGWYFYELNTHIAVPVKNRTYVLRTAEGKYAKLQLISMYKGAPATVTDLNWPTPYLTFRYYVQQDGSRNLSTKD